MSKLIQLEQPTLGEKMLCAGISACASDILTFPFDVAKVRLQLLGETAHKSVSSLSIAASPQYNGLFGTLFGMIKNEGIKSLYGGIGPGLQRQCVYASIRIGFYDSLKEFYAKLFSMNDNASSVMTVRILSGISTGAIGIFFAQPTDVVKVRMQAQTRNSNLPVKYKNSFQAYKLIYVTEGIKGLWKGLGPNIVRNSVVNVAELVCYDSIKDTLIRKSILRDGFICHFTSAFSAGFCATLVASPIDVVKTRYMNATAGRYSSVFHCTKCLVREGGLLAFYKGFTPSFMRIGTWNICMFVTFEQLKKLTTQVKIDRENNKKKTEQLLSLTRTAHL